MGCQIIFNFVDFALYVCIFIVVIKLKNPSSEVQTLRKQFFNV